MADLNEKEIELKRLQLEAEQLRQEIFLQKQREEQNKKNDFVKKNRVDFYYSEDSISLKAGDWVFYYGYGATFCSIHGPGGDHNCKDENGYTVDCPEQDWAFTIEYKDKEIERIPSNKLYPAARRDVFSMLLSGIGLFLSLGNQEFNKNQ